MSTTTSRTDTPPSPGVPTVLVGTPVVPGVALGPVIRPAGAVRLPGDDGAVLPEEERAREEERFAAAAAVVATVATWRYGLAWLGAFGPLADNVERQTSYALPHRLAQARVPEWLALGVAGVAFVLGYAWLLREASRGRARLALAAAFLLLATPYLAPWYVAWLVPLAAAEEDTVAHVLAVALCAYLLPQTVPI